MNRALLLIDQNFFSYILLHHFTEFLKETMSSQFLPKEEQTMRRFVAQFLDNELTWIDGLLPEIRNAPLFEPPPPKTTDSTDAQPPAVAPRKPLTPINIKVCRYTQNAPKDVERECVRRLQSDCQAWKCHELKIEESEEEANVSF